MKKIRRKRNDDGERLIVDYDYSDIERRERTASLLFSNAKNARTPQETEWKRLNDYYNFIRDTYAEVREALEEGELPPPAGVGDPWIAVESQLNPDIPEPEFRGRDDDGDSAKAKERENAVRYVCENNRIEDMNTANERRLVKLGDAYWKAYFDPEMMCGINEGDIRVRDVPVEAMYIDPAVKNQYFQEGQYVAYVYSIHKVKFCQLYGKALRKRGIDPSEIISAGYDEENGLFDMTTSIDEETDSMQMLEFWFHWPEDTVVDGESIPAGAVGCSIQCGGTEVKFIPNYWRNTNRQCKLFPFVHYWRIRDENCFYNKSELFPIMAMVDAADRKLASMLANDELMANDIIVREEDALADGCEIVNAPGAEIITKRGQVNNVRRLGGLTQRGGDIQTLNWMSEQIQRATRNYETNQGKETSRATTASALAMMRSDADTQQTIKNADRTAGFERLYELIDWLCLEFFDDERLIYLGAKKDVREEPISFVYQSDNYAAERPEIWNAEKTAVVRPAVKYWPKVDVTVNAGEGIARNKQATLQALMTLSTASVTAQNYKLYEAMVKLMDLPESGEIIEGWEAQFGAPSDMGQQLAGAMGQQLPGAAPDMLPGGTTTALPPGGMV